jgi:hypothetical protein
MITAAVEQITVDAEASLDVISEGAVCVKGVSP